MRKCFCSRRSRETLLFGSSRSPKCSASAMQELTQAGVASGSTPGVRPLARPKSIRSEQNVQFCATPNRAVGKTRRINEKTSLVRAGDLAIGAADTKFVIDRHNPVGALARRGGRTNMHARRVGAMLAPDRHESATDIWERAGFDVEDLAPLHSR